MLCCEIPGGLSCWEIADKGSLTMRSLTRDLLDMESDGQLVNVGMLIQPRQRPSFTPKWKALVQICLQLIMPFINSLHQSFTRHAAHVCELITDLIQVFFLSLILSSHRKPQNETNEENYFLSFKQPGICYMPEVVSLKEVVWLSGSLFPFPLLFFCLVCWNHPNPKLLLFKEITGSHHKTAPSFMSKCGMRKFGRQEPHWVMHQISVSGISS